MDIAEIIGTSQEELATALEFMDSSAPPGSKIQVTLCTKSLPSKSVLDQVYTDLITDGFNVTKPVATLEGGIPTTQFVLIKGTPSVAGLTTGFPVAAILPLLVPVMVIGLITFGIVKIESISKALVPLMLIAFGGLIIFAAVVTRPSAAPTVSALAGKLVPKARAAV